ncbi:MAG: sodium:proline symporter [Candidatus Sumerlaeota bacterium]|nr:sodium:proline symporter [Candidatus Sumerlaeota bacterium]
MAMVSSIMEAKALKTGDVVHIVDWLIMIVPLIICGYIAIYSRKFVKSVADFMAGGRNAGRFLISAARSEQNGGAVVFVAIFQAFYASGFCMNWWWNISVPVALLVMTTGYVIYRYRETRAMTLGQFFEMRYSRRFRLVTGILGFFAGIVNFGIIPVVGAKCMVYLLQLPAEFQVFSLTVPTHLVLMAIFLSLCVLTTTTGGQISVLLTDCAEGMFSQLFYTLIGLVALIRCFDWGATQAMLLDTAPGKSLVNPFDAFGIADFNIWFVIMATISGNFYRTIAWQNSHAFNSSGASPHESRMGNVLGLWRAFAVTTMVTLLAVCAMTYLHNPQGHAAVQTVLDGIKDTATQDQMRMPTAISQLLPMGINGMLLAVCLMGIISGDGIHLHSWGSILIQDVIMPFRRKPLTPRQHLLLLRLSIVGVALWAFVFGALFPQTKYVQFWWAVTEAIFIGGAGVAVVGGLYWSRGAVAGAWTGLFTGSTLAVTGILADLYCRCGLEEGQEWIMWGMKLSEKNGFILNGVQVSFFSGMVACLAYGVVSWLTCKHPHNMDRLLHRGQYAVEGYGAPSAAPADTASLAATGQETPAAALTFATATTSANTPSATVKRAPWLHRLVGINDQFSRMDRWTTLGIFWWSMLLFAVFTIGSVGYLLLRQSGHDKDYNIYWAYYSLIAGIYLPLLIGAATTIWFTIGCWHDMRVFFKRLRDEKVDIRDDGAVRDDPSAADLAAAEIAAMQAAAAEPVSESAKP